jgi:hypothetical protein
MASPQIISSRSATQERWYKLYRKIHNIFIKDELVHIDDFKTEISNIHKRIDQLNAKLDSNLANVAASHNSHTHQWAGGNAGGPVGGVTVPTPVAFTPDASPIVKTPFVDKNMQAYERALQSTGPGMAPIVATASTDDAAAAAQARSDIGA